MCVSAAGSLGGVRVVLLRVNSCGEFLRRIPSLLWRTFLGRSQRLCEAWTSSSGRVSPEEDWGVLKSMVTVLLTGS